MKLAVGIIVATLSLPSVSGAQSGGQGAHPDLQGRWRPAGDPEAVTANLQMIEAHPGGFGINAGRSLVIDPPDGKIPYQPWALAERNRRRSPESGYESPISRCEPVGPIRLTSFEFAIAYTPPDIVILSDEQHTNRVVHMDGRRHLPENIRLWMGDSLGHWESDTLVVETTNFNGESWITGWGDFFSEAATLVERFTMDDANTVTWTATITDPKVYTRPWTMRAPARFSRDRREQELLEDTCHEGNADLVHLKNSYDAVHGNAQK